MNNIDIIFDCNNRTSEQTKQMMQLFLSIILLIKLTSGTGTKKATDLEMDYQIAVGTPLYISCDCVNCDDNNMMIASQPWCRCCAQAFMVECNSNTTGDYLCRNSTYSMEYCMEKNFWTNCPIAKCPLTKFPDAINHYTSNYTFE